MGANFDALNLSVLGATLAVNGEAACTSPTTLKHQSLQPLNPSVTLLQKLSDDQDKRRQITVATPPRSLSHPLYKPVRPRSQPNTRSPLKGSTV
ncbi:MAG: hypothetical protein SFY66_04105 [Oculatellaceae cyanobacterium bins.114]|nr:hypothetical protein [Oculatellaceae cyanobacterium bins.114]